MENNSTLFWLHTGKPQGADIWFNVGGKWLLPAARTFITVLFLYPDGMDCDQHKPNAMEPFDGFSFWICKI